MWVVSLVRTRLRSQLADLRSLSVISGVFNKVASTVDRVSPWPNFSGAPWVAGKRL